MSDEISPEIQVLVADVLLRAASACVPRPIVGDVGTTVDGKTEVRPTVSAYG
jgi:hypothetical protein